MLQSVVIWCLFGILLSLQLITGLGTPYKPAEETLSLAVGALAEFIRVSTKDWCALAMITDGKTSPHAVYEMVKTVQPVFGIRLYESIHQNLSPNRTIHGISEAIGDITKARTTHECWTVMAVSDDLEFLDTFVGAYKFDSLRVWKRRPIIVTSLPIKRVHDFIQRHWVLFSTSAVVLHVKGKDGKSIGVYSHSSLDPQDGGKVVQTAKWSPHVRLVAVPSTVFISENRVTIKDALKDPFNLGHIINNPKRFRFKVPVLATVAGEHWAAHVIVKKLDENGENYKFGGPMAKLVNAIALSLNFTYKIQQPTDGQWGSLNEDGSWTGLVGQVHRHEADFAVGPHDVTEVRSKYIDYTIPLYYDARKFVAAQKRAEVNPWGFLFPLSSTVWLGVFLSICLVAAISMIVVKNYKKDPWLLYGYNTVFHTYRLLLQQGLTMKMVTVSERLLVMSWIVATMIIYWSYNTNLISLLAVRYAPRPIQTVRDLLDDDNMIVVFPHRTALSDYVLSIESGQLKEVADLRNVGRYTEVPYWEFAQILATVILDGTHVLATDTVDSGSMIANFFSQTGKCQFYRSRETFVPSVLAMVSQKGSPLVAAISHRIQATFEAGFYQHWLDQHVPNSTMCRNIPSTFTVREPLSLSNIWGLFLLLFGGLDIATVVFLVEIIALRMSSNKCFT